MYLANTVLWAKVIGGYQNESLLLQLREIHKSTIEANGDFNIYFGHLFIIFGAQQFAYLNLQAFNH